MRKLRRLKRRKKIRMISMIVILIAVVFIVPAYAYMIQQLEIGGKVKIVGNNSLNVCKGNVTFEVTPWSSGGDSYYKLSFIITNGSDKDYNFWDVYFDVPSDTKIQTYSSTEAVIVGGQIKASNVSYNGNLKPGDSTEFEIQIMTNAIDYEPTTIYVNNCVADSNNTVQNKNFVVEFVPTGGYGNYTYQYDVTVTNNGEEKVQGWVFYIEKPANTKLINAWNVNYIMTDTKIEFSNAAHNGYIEPGQSVTFGAVIETDIEGLIPVAIIE